jgi:hypothetical protein
LIGRINTMSLLDKMENIIVVINYNNIALPNDNGSYDLMITPTIPN